MREAGNLVTIDGWWHTMSLVHMVWFLYYRAFNGTLPNAMIDNYVQNSILFGNMAPPMIMNPAAYNLSNYSGWIAVTADPGSPIDATTGRPISGHYYAILRIGAKFLYLDSYLERAVQVHDGYVRNKLAQSRLGFHFDDQTLNLFRTAFSIVTPIAGQAVGPSGGPSSVSPIP